MATTTKGTKYDPAELKAQTKDLVTAFREMGVKVEGALMIGIEAASLFVEGEAKKRAPVDTGMLRNSITHIVRKEGTDTVGYVGSNSEYGPYQEFGTSKMKPRPFLTPALNENKQNVQRIIENQIKKVMK